ncbi:MAG: HEPN domain-containing protein [Candidatus Gastranaerophilaceae bacterium]
MEQHKQLFINNFWEKSKLALIEARKNIDTDSLMSAQNRIYYSIFYSVVSLGYVEGFTTSKHSTLMGWFNKVFIHQNKIFDKKLFKIYENSFANRMDSDYSYCTEFDKEEIESNYEDAKFFINEVEIYLKSKDILK